ncbi:MAG: HupE/UreJ family protein [Burkholderiales bacterium]|nr:HupE/UreJ family protein [Burkholderiales bacterium]
MSRGLIQAALRHAAAITVTLFVGLGLALPASAHKPSDSYLALVVSDTSPSSPPPALAGVPGAPSGAITGRWDIALRDLDFAIGLDADGNGEITWGEVRVQHDAIAAYALARLSITADDGKACDLSAGPQAIDNHSDGAYTVLTFSVACPAASASARISTPATATVSASASSATSTAPSGSPTTQLQIGYQLFADIDPQHRGLLRLEAGGLSRTAIFSPEAARQTFTLAAASRWSQFVDYTYEGVWHIWIGFDHVLFLLSLLLPAVLVRVRGPGVGLWRGHSGGHWEPVASMRAAAVDVLKIVTAFTLAHSITLSLATLGVVALPTRWVESAIAASVVLAALNNLFAVVGGRRWVVAFVFGLIHGFGFASVLSDLGLPQATLALALVGFNVGVEAGQLVIVAIFLPLAFVLRRTRFYTRGVFVGGSLLIATLAAIWLAERAFLLELISI